MQMKRATVEWRAEGSIEFEVPVGSTDKQIEKLAKEAIRKETGLSLNDVVDWDVTEVEHDNGGF